MWVDRVAEVVDVYNSSWHSTIEAIPQCLWEAPLEQRRRAMELADVRREKGQPKRVYREHFEVGDWVLLYDAVAATAKEEFLRPLWTGPYRLTARMSDSTWRFEEVEPAGRRGRKKVGRVHVTHLQHWDGKR